MTINDSALHRAYMAVSTAVFFEDVAASVLASGTALADARGGALWLHDPNFFRGGSSDSKAAWIRVLDSSLAQEETLPPLAEVVTQSGKVVLQDKEGAFPILVKGQVIGVLHLQWDHAPLPDEKIALFCEHAAISLSNARLFEQMEDAKREWETTFDGMIDGVCVEDAHCTILRANAVMSHFFGIEASQILCRKRDEWSQILPNYEELQPVEPLLHDISGRGVRYGEFRFGESPRIFAETLFELYLSPEENRRVRPLLPTPRDARRYLRVLRDITEQRRLEEQLIQSEKLAALGELVSGVAHELNNPLATVAGYAQLLQDDDTLPTTTRRQIGHIFEEASRASRIVGNLLSFARREEPRNDLLDVNDALRSVVQLRSYQLSAANILVEEEYSNRVPLVRGDTGQLQQVFLNVINNAQGAMVGLRGGGTIKVTTQPTNVGGTRGVLITLSDNGPGIAPDHLRRIFDPFWTTKPAGEGTGLGMSISLGIVSRHDGRIWAESSIGKGARFFIELPGADTGAAEMENIEYSSNGDNAPESNVHRVPQSGSSILLIDDEEPVTLLISEVLALDGHETTAAFNGGEALALLQERDFDLILSDVRMPAVGGPTFFEILQTTRPDLLPRVIFVTGDTMSPSTQQFLQRAARPVMAKPFDPERLRALVRDQLKENE